MCILRPNIYFRSKIKKLFTSPFEIYGISIWKVSIMYNDTHLYAPTICSRNINKQLSDSNQAFLTCFF